MKSSSLMFYMHQIKLAVTTDNLSNMAPFCGLNHIITPYDSGRSNGINSNNSTQKALTWNKWDLVKCLPPLIWHFDSLHGSCLTFAWVPLFAGILHQLSQILPLKCVEHIEEVFAIRYSSLGHLWWKILHELLVSLHHRPELDYSQFIIERNVNSFDLVKFQEILLLDQDFFQEVLVKHVVRRAVQLDWQRQVRSKSIDLRCSLKYRMKSAFELKRPNNSFGMWRRFLVPISYGYYY